MAPRLAHGLLRWLSWIRRCRPDVLQTVRRGLPDLLALLQGAFPAVEWAVVLHEKIRVKNAAEGGESVHLPSIPAGTLKQVRP